LVQIRTYLYLFRPSGSVFEVKKTDFNLKESITLNKGDVVTIEYEGRSRDDIPAGPKFSRIRTDVSWDDLLSELDNFPVGGLYPLHFFTYLTILCRIKIRRETSPFLDFQERE